MPFCASDATEDDQSIMTSSQQSAMMQQLSSQSQFSQPAASQSYQDSLAAVSSTIRHDVDQFLVGLPLGTSHDDAAVEEAVACKLYEALLSKAVMQHKLTEWSVTSALDQVSRAHSVCRRHDDTHVSKWQSGHSSSVCNISSKMYLICVARNAIALTDIFLHLRSAIFTYCTLPGLLHALHCMA